MKRREFLRGGTVVGTGLMLGGLAAPRIARAQTSLKFDSYISETAGPS